MRKEFDEKLCEKYPLIFVNRNASMTKTAMCWGFDCGDGWYTLIDVMCNHIQWYIDNKNRFNSKEAITQVVATQVKEKFGTLSFYFTGGDSYIDGIVNMAEAMSAHTCEICGAPGSIRNNGWLRTLCDEDSDVHIR